MNETSGLTRQSKRQRVWQMHRRPSAGAYPEELDGHSFHSGNIQAAKPKDFFGPQRFVCPETRLMLAVLDDAIQCFLRYRGTKKRKEQKVFQATKDWILSNESDSIFSFENVCEIVEIDPDCIRGALFRSGAAQKAAGRNTLPVVFAPRTLPNDHRTRASSRERRISSVPVLLRKAG
jgi:hypothetical protein